MGVDGGHDGGFTSTVINEGALRTAHLAGYLVDVKVHHSSERLHCLLYQELDMFSYIVRFLAFYHSRDEGVLMLEFALIIETTFTLYLTLFTLKLDDFTIMNIMYRDIHVSHGGSIFLVTTTIRARLLHKGHT
jgi:hypothetical protein